MWRRLVLPLLPLIAMLGLAGTVLAQSAGGVTISGPETISGSDAQPQIALSGNATDGSGWQLQATLIAQNQGSVGRSGVSGRRAGIPISGKFTLSHAGIAPIQGDVAGSVNQAGSGTLHLSGSDGQTDFVAAADLGGSGSFTLDLTGALPALPPAAALASAAAPATNHTFWYISRAAGLTAYLLLTLSVCLGLLVRTRVMDWLAARWRWFDLHQFTALLALGFIALHIFSLLGDHYIGFRLDELFVPFASPYRPVWVALGIIALYLMLIVVASFSVRRLISYGAWRAIHYVTFGIFLLALLHGVLAGGDTGQIWTTALYWASCMAVAGLSIWRFTASSGGRSHDAAPPPKRPTVERRRRELTPTLR